MVVVKGAKQVDYTVDPKAANAQIEHLNKLAGDQTPEAISGLMASSIAAIAYMMLATNDIIVVKHIFNSIIDDAQKQQANKLKIIKQ